MAGEKRMPVRRCCARSSCMREPRRQGDIAQKLLTLLWCRRLDLREPRTQKGSERALATSRHLVDRKGDPDRVHGRVSASTDSSQAGCMRKRPHLFSLAPYWKDDLERGSTVWPPAWAATAP